MESDSQRPLMDAEGKRLTLVKLADYLEAQQGAITDQWLLAVRRDPEIATADRLTHQQLVDHLPDIYKECCAFLRTRDAAALIEGAKNDAKTHGGIRWADGYQIDELIRELEVFRGILGGTLSRYGDLDPRFRGPAEASASALVHRFFGEVTVNSVAQYAEEQQAVISTYTHQLETANLELGRANTNLQRELSERQRLTAVIAHEVRNFLQGLKLPPSRDESSNAAVAEDSSAQLREVEELLTQLLDHSTLIANREPLITAEFQPAKLHEELVQLHRATAQRKGLAFIGGCAEAPQYVVGDALKIKQIASSLLSNALKFTNEGHVSLTMATADSKRWVIRIADSGPGLNAQAAQRLFGGLGGADVQVPRGGIGLAITKDLVDLLGGSIQVVTKAGAGTVIEVFLPTGLEST
jgi:signal transduction histidine kinase